jgi:type II secretory pathway pseudopilin PulG
MDSDRVKSIRRRCALTTIETLVVVAVLGLLLALLGPLLLGSREESHRVQCSDNLRQIGMALNEQMLKHRHFSPSHSNFGRLNDSSWMTRLLPSINEQTLFENYQFQLPFGHLANAQVSRQNIGIQLCPASTHQDSGQGDYAAVYGPSELLGRKKGWQKGRAYAAGIMIATGGDTENQPVRPSDVTDGLGKTILLGEDAGRLDESRFWADPYNAFVHEGAINQSRADEIFSDHPGGAFILLADGKVHFLSESVDVAVVSALATRSEGEIIPTAVLPAGN